MNISTLVPKFRIEIRRTGSPKNAPWDIAELAHTENHVTAKLPYWKNNPDIEHRVVENLPAAPAPVRLQPELQRIPPPPQITPPTPKLMTKPDPLPPPAIVATGPAANSPVAPGSEVSALATPSPELPFKVGDRLQDMHVPGHPPLIVTAINPDGRPGFSWDCPENDNPADRSGFCPVESVGNWEIWDAKKHGGSSDHSKDEAPAEAAAVDPSAKSGADAKPAAPAAKKARPPRKHAPKKHAAKKSASRKR